ncbi:ChaN family lipoprotein [Shimia sp. MMG029]|uniref:ChaN family lipoprotein n=1 Tax=Shimia sp. MMG029 TaxID=3021978 RepID=UPI0022FF2D49|nr:ChaN family lipoprotein [Shimia sp. MMG029]MDA5558415.1 ChaN family lipoprotein [Shimia sp. MMG029]
MKQMVTAAALAFALAGDAAKAEQLDHTLLQGVDVVFLGEVHDNPVHHSAQAGATLALAPKAMVFEMLTPEQAALVTPELLDDEAALGQALAWDDSGWPEFSMYYPIFAVSGGARIYGAQVPRGLAREVLSSGNMDAAMAGEASQYKLTEPLPEAQQTEREALQMEAHCNALPEEMLPIMVMAQRLRDARLAQSATQALRETGGPVVVITGNGHVRNDWGAPTLMDPSISVVTFGQLEAEPETAPPYDTWVVTAPVEREDPCAAFQ